MTKSPPLRSCLRSPMAIEALSIESDGEVSINERMDA